MHGGRNVEWGMREIEGLTYFKVGEEAREMMST